MLKKQGIVGINDILGRSRSFLRGSYDGGRGATIVREHLLNVQYKVSQCNVWQYNEWAIAQFEIYVGNVSRYCDAQFGNHRCKMLILKKKHDLQTRHLGII